MAPSRCAACLEELDVLPYDLVHRKMYTRCRYSIGYWAIITFSKIGNFYIEKRNFNANEMGRPSTFLQVRHSLEKQT
jgi:hypothetical protein